MWEAPERTRHLRLRCIAGSAPHRSRPRAPTSGGDEGTVTEEWDGLAAVELGSNAHVVGEADLDQLSAAGALVKRGRDIVSDGPVRRRCGVCLGGDVRPSGFVEEIDETAGSPLILNGWSEAAVWPALARGDYRDPQRRLLFAT